MSIGIRGIFEGPAGERQDERTLGRSTEATRFPEASSANMLAKVKGQIRTFDSLLPSYPAQ